MTSSEQKRIWKKEKEQQLRDKQSQGRIVKRRKATIKLGGKKKPKTNPPTPANPSLSDQDSDTAMRNFLGL